MRQFTNLLYDCAELENNKLDVHLLNMDEEEVSSVRQTMLYNIGIHDTVLELLKNNF